MISALDVASASDALTYGRKNTYTLFFDLKPNKNQSVSRYASAAMTNQNDAWYACETLFVKERSAQYIIIKNTEEQKEN